MLPVWEGVSMLLQLTRLSLVQLANLFLLLFLFITSCSNSEMQGLLPSVEKSRCPKLKL